MVYLIVAIVCFFMGFLVSQMIDNELIVTAKRRADETAKKYAARDYYARNMCRVQNGERIDSIPEQYKW